MTRRITTASLVIVLTAIAACSAGTDMRAQTSRQSSARSDAAPHAQPNAIVAITGVTIVDASATDPAAAAHPAQTVLIMGGRIRQVGPTSSIAIPPGAQVVDARGQFLIPGLWDAHAHVTTGGHAALAALVANGVTTVRDMGGRLPELLAFRREIGAGTRTGPRLFVAGVNIEGAWWLDPLADLIDADSLLRAYRFLERSPRMRLAGPADAAAIIDSLAGLGVDHVKFRNLRRDEFLAIAAASAKRGLPLSGHAPGLTTVGEAAEAGLRSLEHSETVMLKLGGASAAERRSEFARVARAGSAMTPTLVTDLASRQTPASTVVAMLADTASVRDVRRRYIARELLGQWKFGLDLKRLEGPASAEAAAESRRVQVADIRLAREAGVPLLVGTDLGVALVFPGSSVHEEMRLLVEEAGLSAFEALRAATIAPARTMRVADSIGVIAPGGVADLVLLTADPLSNIRNTTRIGAVVVDGRVLLRADLDRLLDESARLARASFTRVSRGGERL